MLLEYATITHAFPNRVGAAGWTGLALRVRVSSYTPSAWEARGLVSGRSCFGFVQQSR